MTVILGTVASEKAYINFAPWVMMPPYSCWVPGRKPGTSSKVISGMLKQSQKRTKRAPLMLALMSSTPARKLGWLATMPTGLPWRRGESDDDVAGVIFLHLEEVSVVHHAIDDVLDVVGNVRLGGDECVERLVGAVGGIGASLARRVFEIVGGHEAEQLAHHAETFGVVVGEKVRDAGLLVVGHGSAELFFRDFLMRD